VLAEAGGQLKRGLAAALKGMKARERAAGGADGAGTPSGLRLGGPRLYLLAGAVVIVGLGIYFGVHARSAAEARLKQATQDALRITVNVVSPVPTAPDQEIVLPGNTQAFVTAPINARTNGYLEHWYFDIGAHVKRGDLLAKIATPEVDQQLQQARADLKSAEANLAIAKITAGRWQALVENGAVSRQETDQTATNLRAAKAAVDSNTANVRRLENLQSFETVYAPFDGVITARNTDIGALIDAGSSGQGRQLFQLADIRTIRVYVAVPEVHAQAVQQAAEALLTLDQFPGQVFHGTVTRNSNAIDPASRTLLTEVDVDNQDGRLMPGAYAFVHLKLPKQIRSVTIPANTLLFRSEGLTVGIVHNGQAELVPVRIGRDYGATVEVVAGLEPTDSVIVDPPDSLVSGTPVQTTR
jgi:RND family efflux transporter MFP subunit